MKAKPGRVHQDYEYCMRATEQKVSGQTSFESPTHSRVFLSCAVQKDKLSSRCQKSLTPVI